MRRYVPDQPAAPRDCSCGLPLGPNPVTGFLECGHCDDGKPHPNPSLPCRECARVREAMAL